MQQLYQSSLRLNDIMDNIGQVCNIPSMFLMVVFHTVKVSVIVLNRRLALVSAWMHEGSSYNPQNIILLTKPEESLNVSIVFKL